MAATQLYVNINYYHYQWEKTDNVQVETKLNLQYRYSLLIIESQVLMALKVMCKQMELQHDFT